MELFAGKLKVMISAIETFVREVLAILSLIELVHVISWKQRHLYFFVDC